jgi:hypothetical protein
MANTAVLDPGALAQKMISKATNVAGADWADIAQVATHEFHVLGQRIVEIANAFDAGRLPQDVAIQLFAMARNHMIATIAMLSTKLVMMVQKIVDAAVSVIRSAVNTKIGFALV